MTTTEEQRRTLREKLEREEKEREADRKAASAFLSLPSSAPLFRYLERIWNRRGVGDRVQETAYRVALRDALEELKDIRKEGEEHAA